MDDEIKHVVQHLLIVALTDVPDQLVFGIGNDRGHPLTPNKVQVDPPTFCRLPSFETSGNGSC